MFNLFSKPKHMGKRGEELPQNYEGFPDSSHTGGLCTRCGKQSSFDIVGYLPVTYDRSIAICFGGTEEKLVLDRIAVLMCRHCKHGIAVIEEQMIGDHPTRERITGGGTVTYRGIFWWPLPETILSKDVPEIVSSAFSEAMTSLYANCPRASAVMARRTLEAIVVNMGETEGDLAPRLEKLAKKGILQTSLAEWAKEIRLIGNIGAHYDPINKIDYKDAEQLLKFVREIIRYLYELPKDLDRIRSVTK